jgi:hypothetical protein
LYEAQRVKAWTEAHVLYEALMLFIQNVLRSTLLHANKTTTKMHSILNKNKNKKNVYKYTQHIQWLGAN